MLAAALPLICAYIAGFYHSFFLYLSGAGLKRYNPVISEEVAKSMSGIIKRNNKGSGEESSGLSRKSEGIPG